MKLILFLSDFCMPFVVCWIVIYGWLGGCPVFDTFVKGAKRGLKTVAGILPTLIGLMAAVRLLRDSGLLDRIADVLTPLADSLRIPAQVIPLILVKLFSASAATGILLDIFENFGPDSYAGMLAAVIASSAETVLFVMSVYLTHVGIRKSRWILPGAMICTAAGILAAVMVTGMMMPE
ncbi:MAG: spore maturation protein [Lachnospiraceae bacterium]|nr:spore maturation protein [Lachnospiraceae bacterium]